MQLENSHGGFAGRSLINIIQEALDKAYMDFQEATIKHGEIAVDNTQLDRLQGYVAGIAKALGILRGTSVKSEISEARERISEQNKSIGELISV